MTNNQYTAAILNIGNEILSGRIKEGNAHFIASRLFSLGIILREVLVIPDEEDIIINEVNDLRKKYSFVFTTGGIGPTHDDITSEAIAKAFRVKLVRREEAVKRIKEKYREAGDSILLDEALKMADIPDGADLIANNVSGAPGYKIGNVFVMAGVPEIMQSMFLYLEKTFLPSAQKIFAPTITLFCGETKISEYLRNLQNEYKLLQIGSYPFKKDEKWITDIVVTGRDKSAINSIITRFTEYLESHDIKFKVND